MVCNHGCLCLTLAILSFSCGGKEKAEISYSNLGLVDSVEIKLPLDYIPHTKWQTFEEKEITYLVEYGFDKNRDLLILLVDFNKGEYLEPITIPNEGPDGFNASDAYISFQGMDSIFVFPSAKDRFFLYDSSAKIIQTYHYTSDEPYRFYSSSVFSDVSIHGDRLIMPTIDNTPYDDKSFFEKVRPVQQYDFSTQQLAASIAYPAFTYGKFSPTGHTGAQVSRVNDSLTVINYRFADSVYFFSSTTNQIKGEYMGIGNPVRLMESLPTRVESMNALIKDPDYEFVYHHQGKLYRLVSHLEHEKYSNFPLNEIIEQNLKGVSLLEKDLETREMRVFKMPLARYFVFQGDKLIVGGISAREDEHHDTYRKFYVYQLE